MAATVCATLTFKSSCEASEEAMLSALIGPYGLTIAHKGADVSFHVYMKSPTPPRAIRAIPIVPLPSHADIEIDMMQTPSRDEHAQNVRNSLMSLQFVLDLHHFDDRSVPFVGAAVPPLLNALETKFLYVLCLRTAKCNPDDVPSDIRPFLSKAIQTHELMVHSNLAAQDVKRLDDFLAHVCRGSNMNDNPRGRSRLDRCAKEAHGRILRMGVATMLQLHDADADLFKGESLFTRQERQAHAILAYRQIVEALDSVERVAQMTRAVVLCIMQGTWGVGVAVDVRTCTPPSDGPVVAPCSVVAPRLGADEYENVIAYASERLTQQLQFQRRAIEAEVQVKRLECRLREDADLQSKLDRMERELEDARRDLKAKKVNHHRLKSQLRAARSGPTSPTPTTRSVDEDPPSEELAALGALVTGLREEVADLKARLEEQDRTFRDRVREDESKQACLAARLEESHRDAEQQKARHAEEMAYLESERDEWRRKATAYDTERENATRECRTARRCHGHTKEMNRMLDAMLLSISAELRNADDQYARNDAMLRTIGQTIAPPASCARAPSASMA